MWDEVPGSNLTSVLLVAAPTTTLHVQPEGFFMSPSFSASLQLPLEKETHSSILAWEIPWREGPGGPQSMGLQRVRHNSATEQQHLEVACYLVLNLNIIKII